MGGDGAAGHAARRLLARAVMLDDTAVEVLGAAAAAGGTLPEVLADVCGVSAEAVRTTLDRLFACALLVRDGDEVRFRHELGREVFYDELVPGERAASTPCSPAASPVRQRSGG